MIKFCERVAHRQNTVKWTQSALCLSHTCKVRESSDHNYKSEYCSQLNIEGRYCLKESLIPFQITTLAPAQKETRSALHTTSSRGRETASYSSLFRGVLFRATRASSPTRRSQSRIRHNVHFYPQNKRPYLFLQPWSRHWTQAIDIIRLIYTTVVFKYATKNRFH